MLPPSLSLPTGHLHHRVHVLRKLEAVPEEDQEESQDHEREGDETVCLAFLAYFPNLMLLNHTVKNHVIIAILFYLHIHSIYLYTYRVVICCILL